MVATIIYVYLGYLQGSLMLFDFHTHSYYSDGLLSPKELIRHAKDMGLSLIALTDHDTTDGLEQAQVEAAKLKIKFIKGIEISTFDYEHPSIHILGLDIKDLSVFENMQKQNQESRKKRNLLILQKIKDLYGIEIDYNDLEKECKGTIGKGNISQYLTHHKYYPTYKDANAVVMQFKNLPCGIEVKKAIDLIHQAGGLAFLAHPHSLKLSNEDIEIKIKKLKNLGLDGVEYAHSKHTTEQTELYKQIAIKLGLKLSAGSDFHGAYKKGVELAYGKSEKPLGYEHLIDWL